MERMHANHEEKKNNVSASTCSIYIKYCFFASVYIVDISIVHVKCIVERNKGKGKKGRGKAGVFFFSYVLWSS